MAGFRKPLAATVAHTHKIAEAFSSSKKGKNRFFFLLRTSLCRTNDIVFHGTCAARAERALWY